MKTYNRSEAGRGMLLSCPKSPNGAPPFQRYRGTMKHGKHQQYDIYVCSCTGKRHTNRLIVGKFYADKRLPKDQGFSKPGYSIFGQRLKNG